MQTNIAETRAKELAAMPKAWGTESVSSKDVAYTFLTIGKDNGEIKKSTNGEVLGGVDKAVQVICFKHMKEHQYVDRDGKTLDRHPYQEGLKNEKLMLDGVEVERLSAHVFFLLVIGREEEGPMIYTARKTSRWAVEKTILPAIKAGERIGSSIASNIYEFKSELKQNAKKQKYYVCNFTKLTHANEKQEGLAYGLYCELQKAEKELSTVLEETPHEDAE